MKKLLPTLTLSALLVTSLSAQERGRDQRSPRGKIDQPKIDNIDWDRVKERIEGAVKRGDITREQANQKYIELKKRIATKPEAKRDQPLRAKPENSRQGPGQQRRPDALGRVLGELIAQKKINREDAKKIFEAAYAGRPQPANRRNPQGEVAEELRDVLDQARKELAEIREARREMFEEREEHEHHDHDHKEHRHDEEHDHHGHDHEEQRERIDAERAEHMERVHEARRRAEMARKRAEEEQKNRVMERRKQELERYKEELMKQKEILERERLQLAEAQKQVEKQNRERKEKSKEKK